SLTSYTQVHTISLSSTTYARIIHDANLGIYPVDHRIPLRHLQLSLRPRALSSDRLQSGLHTAEEQAIDKEQSLSTIRSGIDGVSTDADSPALLPLHQQVRLVKSNRMVPTKQIFTRVETREAGGACIQDEWHKIVLTGPLCWKATAIESQSAAFSKGWTHFTDSFWRTANVVKNAKYILRLYTREPDPTLDQQVIKFEEARDTLAELLVSNRPGLDLGPGKSFDTENLAESLQHNFILLNGITEKAPTRSFFEEYLKSLKKYQLIIDEIQGVRSTWIAGMPLKKGGETHDMMNEVTTFIKEHPNFMDEFKEEHELVVNEFAAAQNFKISKEFVRQHFEVNSLMSEVQKPINLERFVKARAVQLTRKLANNREILDLEHVFQHLPADLDLKSELFRYSMIRRFENILESIRPDLTRDLENRAHAQIKDFIRRFGTTAEHDSIFMDVAKEDDAWHANAFSKFYGIILSPSEVYEKLIKPPTPQETHAHVINELVAHAKVLSEEGRNQLRGAATLETFRNEIAKHKQVLESRRAPRRARTSLEVLEHYAARSFSVNLPLVHELFDKGVIDTPLRNLLIKEAWVSPKQFAAALGTEEDFTKKMVERFEINLVDYLGNIDIDRTNEISSEAARRVAQSSLNQLDHDARSTYLRPDAFQKPNSFRFDEAWKVYYPDVSGSTQQHIDSKALLRAYMDMAFSVSPFNRKTERYPRAGETRELMKDHLDKKLYEMENIFYEHLPAMGEFLEKLVKDSSPPGTPYPNSVPVSSRQIGVPYGSIDSGDWLVKLLSPAPAANNIK
ncbi:hypothetical protein PSTT_14620, partial [Puccinia striiformis]